MAHYTTATKEILKLWTPEQIRAVLRRSDHIARNPWQYSKGQTEESPAA